MHGHGYRNYTTRTNRVEPVAAPSYVRKVHTDYSQLCLSHTEFYVNYLNVGSF